MSRLPAAGVRSVAAPSPVGCRWPPERMVAVLRERNPNPVAIPEDRQLQCRVGGGGLLSGCSSANAKCATAYAAVRADARGPRFPHRFSSVAVCPRYLVFGRRWAIAARKQALPLAVTAVRRWPAS